MRICESSLKWLIFEATVVILMLSPGYVILNLAMASFAAVLWQDSMLARERRTSDCDARDACTCAICGGRNRQISAGAPAHEVAQNVAHEWGCAAYTRLRIFRKLLTDCTVLTLDGGKDMSLAQQTLHIDVHNFDQQV